MLSEQAILAVKLVKAIQRIPEKVPRGVTFFSRFDLWQYNAVLDNVLCMDCVENEARARFFGDELRTKFPYLTYIDDDTLGGPGPDGRGLVHPNCRCKLTRIKEWTPDVLEWFVTYAGRRI